MPSIPFGVFEMGCPKCNSKIIFMEKAKGYGIKINCETEGEFHIPNMYHLFSKCNNPFCEWSVIQDEF